MPKISRFIIALVILSLFVIAVRSKKKAVVVPSGSSVTQAGRTHQAVTFDVLPDIKKAQAMLANEDAGYYLKDVIYTNGKKGLSEIRWAGKKLDDFNILLVVESITDRKIEIIKLTQKGSRSPSGFSVDCGKSNGVNTPYDVRYPAGYIVLSMRRVVRDGKGFKEVVYTPYTPEIDTVSMRERGLLYLEDNLRTAEAELKSKAVRSKSFDCLVTEAVPKNVALTLCLIEHIDPGRFKSGKPVERLMNEVLVIAAANEDHAYVYSVSRTGARGLFQFMPHTYKSICARYPVVGLDNDFVSGMDNHKNAAIASLLLFDSDLSCLPFKHRQFLQRHPEAMGKYLAASYNGGPSRAAKAIRQYKSEWESHVLPETQCYLEEFNAVWNLLYPA